MGSGQIYKGTQSFALYWVGAAAAATSASEQSSVRISVCQSVLLLLLLQPPLHILKTETFYFVANLFRFVLFFCRRRRCRFFVAFRIIFDLRRCESVLLQNAKYFSSSSPPPLPLSSSTSSHSSSFSYTLE